MNYSGISFKAYSKYLTELKNQGHKFLTATKFLKLKSDVFWRHDIDYSIDASVRLAQLEKGLEVCATYYVDLNTYFYNALSVSNIKKIKFIDDHGHEIGIHFDPRLLKHNEHDELQDKIFEYSNVFFQNFDIKPKSFTFHRPNSLTEKFTRSHYGGLINCYSTEFFNIGHYCSDSNGYWRHKSIAEVIKQVPPLHILTHPGWWGLKERAPRDRILDIILQQAFKAVEEYDTDMVQDGRENFSLSLNNTEHRPDCKEVQFLLDCLLTRSNLERKNILSFLQSKHPKNYSTNKLRNS